MPVTLTLSPGTEARLRDRAAESGRDLDEYATLFFERAVVGPGIGDLLAPVREQVAASGASEAEVMDFGRDLLAKVRAERNARRHGGRGSGVG